MCKDNRTFFTNLLIARNENEIIELMEQIKELQLQVEALRQQNRDLLGRGIDNGPKED